MRLACLVLVCCSSFLLVVAGQAENWPGWRGPRGDGTSHEASLPTKWNGLTGENIAWKVDLPGWGHSSPIVWEDSVFLTSCNPEDETRLLLRLEAATGREVWRQTVLKAPLEKRHKLNSFSSGTPATDGRLVYVTFLEPDFSSLSERTPGNLVVAAYDFAGKQQWLVRPGRFASTHGFCSSPVIYRDLLIINGDHDGDGYLVALQRDSGQQVWKTERPNHTRSYVTPLIREIAGQDQLMLSGSISVASYDPQTGRQQWYLPGPTEQFVASLVYNGKYVFLTAGFPDKHILAIKPQGSATRTDEEAIAWRTTRNCSYVPSPALVGDYLVVVADNGIATCFEANTGKVYWTQRLDTKNHSASLISWRDLVMITADDGVTRVIRPGQKWELVSENPLGDDVYSSAAISDGRLFLRGRQRLYCVAAMSTSASSK